MPHDDALVVGPVVLRLSQLQRAGAHGKHEVARVDRSYTAKSALISCGKRPTSHYRGVNLHARSGRWEAHIWNGQQVHLGCFMSELHAAIAYDLAAMRLKGAKAQLNFDDSCYAPFQSRLVQMGREELLASLRGPSGRKVKGKPGGASASALATSARAGAPALGTRHATMKRQARSNTRSLSRSSGALQAVLHHSQPAPGSAAPATPPPQQQRQQPQQQQQQQQQQPAGSSGADLLTRQPPAASAGPQQLAAWSQQPWRPPPDAGASSSCSSSLRSWPPETPPHHPPPHHPPSHAEAASQLRRSLYSAQLLPSFSGLILAPPPHAHAPVGQGSWRGSCSYNCPPQHVPDPCMLPGGPPPPPPPPHLPHHPDHGPPPCHCTSCSAPHLHPTAGHPSQCMGTPHVPPPSQSAHTSLSSFHLPAAPSHTAAPPHPPHHAAPPPAHPPHPADALRMRTDRSNPSAQPRAEPADPYTMRLQSAAAAFRGEAGDHRSAASTLAPHSHGPNAFLPPPALAPTSRHGRVLCRVYTEASITPSLLHQPPTVPYHSRHAQPAVPQPRTSTHPASYLQAQAPHPHPLHFPHPTTHPTEHPHGPIPSHGHAGLIGWQLAHPDPSASAGAPVYPTLSLAVHPLPHLDHPGPQPYPAAHPTRHPPADPDPRPPSHPNHDLTPHPNRHSGPQPNGRSAAHANPHPAPHPYHSPPSHLTPHQGHNLAPHPNHHPHPTTPHHHQHYPAPFHHPHHSPHPPPHGPPSAMPHLSTSPFYPSLGTAPGASSPRPALHDHTASPPASPYGTRLAADPSSNPSCCSSMPRKSNPTPSSTIFSASQRLHSGSPSDDAPQPHPLAARSPSRDAPPPHPLAARDPSPGPPPPHSPPPAPPNTAHTAPTPRLTSPLPQHLLGASPDNLPLPPAVPVHVLPPLATPDIWGLGGTGSGGSWGCMLGGPVGGMGSGGSWGCVVGGPDGSQDQDLDLLLQESLLPPLGSGGSNPLAVGSLHLDPEQEAGPANDCSLERSPSSAGNSTLSNVLAWQC